MAAFGRRLLPTTSTAPPTPTAPPVSRRTAENKPPKEPPEETETRLLQRNKIAEEEREKRQTEQRAELDRRSKMAEEAQERRQTLQQAEWNRQVKRARTDETPVGRYDRIHTNALRQQEGLGPVEGPDILPAETNQIVHNPGIPRPPQPIPATRPLIGPLPNSYSYPMVLLGAAEPAAAAAAIGNVAVGYNLALNAFYGMTIGAIMNSAETAYARMSTTLANTIQYRHSNLTELQRLLENRLKGMHNPMSVRDRLDRLAEIINGINELLRTRTPQTDMMQALSDLLEKKREE